MSIQEQYGAVIHTSDCPICKDITNKGDFTMNKLLGKDWKQLIIISLAFGVLMGIFAR